MLFEEIIVGKKARYFEELYPQSIRVIDKENGGHGSVINRGIKEATGKYYIG